MTFKSLPRLLLGAVLLVAAVGSPAPLSAAAVAWTAMPYASAPIDNPLKGFMPYAGNYPTFPHSMEFFYMPLRDVMTGPSTFTWHPLDAQLNQTARRGHQAVFRFYLDYPGRPSGIPTYLLNEGLKTHSYSDYDNSTSVSPNYDDPRLRAAMAAFILALGRRYDGDPRIGFIQVGLIGFWGEWHTYPHDEWIASLTTMDQVLKSYTSAFHRTRLLVRFPADPIHLFPLGYHDDSFAYDTLANGSGNFMDLLTQVDLQNAWRTEPIGGELRPELQSCIWRDPSCARAPQDFDASVDATHASWLLNQWIFDHRLAPADYARALQGSRRLGYELSVAATSFSHAGSTRLVVVRVQMRDTGTAPFYYDWPIDIGLVGKHHLLATWPTDWRLTTVLPGAVVGFSARLALPVLAPGTYTLVMRAANPLPNGKPVGFANKAQDASLLGWLALGELSDSTP